MQAVDGFLNSCHSVTTDGGSITEQLKCGFQLCRQTNFPYSFPNMPPARMLNHYWPSFLGFEL